MKVRVTVMPKAGVLDPQGKAIGHALAGLGFGGVGEVRAGKVIELELAETDPQAAKQRRRGHGPPAARQHGDRELPGGDRLEPVVKMSLLVMAGADAADRHGPALARGAHGGDAAGRQGPAPRLARERRSAR